jgi:hypothetical protein
VSWPLVPRTLSDTEKPPKEGGSWYNWWPGPVISSGSAIAWVGLGLAGLVLVLLGTLLLWNRFLWDGLLFVAASFPFLWLTFRRPRWLV